MVPEIGTFLPELVARRGRSDRRHDVYLEEVGGRRLDWAEADREGDAWASQLSAAGVGEGDRVLTMLPTCATGVTVWVGVGRLGAIEVPINTELVGTLLQHVVDTAGATAAIVSVRFLDVVVPCLRAAGVRHLFVPDADPSDRAVHAGRAALASVVGGPPELVAPVVHRRCAPWDTALILFTSGTTGPSKGVVVPWGQMEETCIGSIPLDDLGADDVYYCPFGMAHVTARSAAYLMAMLGGRLVLRERFSTSSYWADVADHGCTTTVMMGTMAHFLAQQPPSDADAATPLRNVLVAPLIPGIEEMSRRFGFRVCTVFNMTEVSAPITSGGWSIDDTHCCGTVRDGFECRVVDEHDCEVPVGAVGELVVRHTRPWTLMNGYFREPAKTAEAWRNLWFHTGDAFSRDADGRFTFRDRIKDVIRRRGENISSVELEQQVCAHPEIVDAASIGVPAAVGEEDVAIFVVRRSSSSVDASALSGFLEQRLPRFMQPRFIEFVDVLPRTSTEKLDKKQLRARGVSVSAWDRDASATARAPSAVHG